MKELGALGMDGARLRRVEEAMAADIAARRYDGAALRVHRRGRLVLDTIQGYAHQPVAEVSTGLMEETRSTERHQRLADLVLAAVVD